jgi:lipopolysaccharide export system protein LptA
MAAFIVKNLALIALMAPAIQAGGAASKDTQQPINLDSSTVDVDLRTNTAIFTKVRISQGNMSITADQARAAQTTGTAALNFDNNLWVFRGNVKITMGPGSLNSDEAQITFVNQLLTRAVATGKPAYFEQLVAKTGKVAKGRADTIDYDVAKGVVHLSKDAYVSDGDREITGQSLRYNVGAQSISAEAPEQGSQRVHIIITPPPPKSAPPATPSATAPAATAPPPKPTP